MSGRSPVQSVNDRSLYDTESGESISEKNARTPTRQSHFSRAYLLGPVQRDHADLALLGCCFVTGMIDVASFANWSVFVGGQTGNTIILGLSASLLPPTPYAWLSTLISLASFLIGCYATFRITNFFAPSDPYSNRLVVVSLFLVQSLFIILAAALVTVPGLIPQNPPSLNERIAPINRATSEIEIVSILPPLAFQAGVQISASRLLGYQELPINVVTSTYCDIMGDFNLFALNNVKRNRRVAAAVLLLAGAISSGWLMRSPGGLMSVLWTAAGIKLVIAGAVLCFMPRCSSFEEAE